jgi:hypothetical protein
LGTSKNSASSEPFTRHLVRLRRGDKQYHDVESTGCHGTLDENWMSFARKQEGKPMSAGRRKDINIRPLSSLQLHLQQ